MRIRPSASRLLAAGTAATVVAVLVLSFLTVAFDARAFSLPSGGSRTGDVDSPGTPGDPAVWGISEVIRESNRGNFAPEPPQGPALLRLGAGYEINPEGGAPEAALPANLRATPPTGDERGYFIVQFRGPITDQDRAVITSAGGEIIHYIPDYAYLVALKGRAQRQVAVSPRVAWSGLYQPAYKISTMPQMREPGRHELVVLLFPQESVEAARQSVAAVGATVVETSDNGVNKILKVEVDMANLAALASLPGVAWIEPFQVPQWHNNQCQWTVQTNLVNNRHLWDMGLKGQNQIVSLCDTGIRVTHKQFFDPSVPIIVFGDYPTHRKVIAYKKSVPSVNVVFGDEGINGYHGTHTSCTIAGDDSPLAADARDGMAINAKIYFVDGGGNPNPGVFIPLDLNDLFIQPYTGNGAGAARVMSNSWGNSNGGVYDTQSMAADQFMWNHPDFLLFFSNGNDGGPNTVGSPATAKNVVSAGGTGNGTLSNTIYTATSRGPTDDGRRKPTICSPATLSSAYGVGDTGYVTYSGTSMASPCMTGATALLRQYLNDGWYPTGAAVPGNSIPTPSAALLKAMAVNSADNDITGYTAPDNNIGWGRINDESVAYFAGDSRRLALVDNNAGLLTGEYVEYQVYVADGSIPLKASLVWTDYWGVPEAAVELVNDLNFTATDGTNTYKGNVYSGGQSITGGSYDDRNVEECVRRNTPTVGLWTFRIEGFNVPIGPQKFALVITGGLGSDAGIVTLNKAVYSGTDLVSVRVVDTNAGSSITVNAASNTEAGGEDLVLTGAGGVYTGSLSLNLSYPIGGNGSLSVSDGDQITVTYQDVSPPTTLTAKALVNISGPAISDVHATTINETDVTLAWNTTSPSNSKVYYGTTPGLGMETPVSSTLSSAHSVVLSSLTPSTLYYYDVESFDNQGNGVRDDNGGLHYTVSTDNNRDVLLAIGDATFVKKQYYLNALARSGWTYTVWEGAQSATPYVGNLISGMASYKAVVWQTGLEQYPMFTDAARDSIAKLDLLGSRLAVYSQDVAWDFSDPTSPDYSAARKAWFENELKATWQVDPTTFSLIRGYAGDPISGAYTGGISYTPHRDGAAGDEVNGIATGGSFSNVWKDTADDIAIRYTSSGPVGDPTKAVWGGTPRKVSSNFFEWAHMNVTTPDDPVRSDVLDKTLIWLVGHDHPSAAVVAPNGGETFTGSSVSVSWTESVDGGYSVASRKIYYSNNSGDNWTLITSSAGPSPFSWDISAIPNGAQYRVRVVLADNGSPALAASDLSNANFTINRPGGDSRGPVVLAGSMAANPNPILVPNPAVLSAIVSDVYTGNSNITAAEWSKGATPAPAGSGTAMSGSFTSPMVTVSYALDSTTLSPGSETFWVRGRDAGGNWGNPSSLVVQVNTPTSDVQYGIIPARFALYGNTPNPFRPRTEIGFDLPRPSQVRLEVYDVSGRRIRTLADGPMDAGSKRVSWDGSDSNGRPMSSGIYFYKLEAGSFEAVKKMTLLK